MGATREDHVEWPQWYKMETDTDPAFGDDLVHPMEGNDRREDNEVGNQIEQVEEEMRVEDL